VASQPSVADELDSDLPAEPSPQRWATRVAVWLDSPVALDLLLCLVFACFAFWLTRGLWPDPGTHALAHNADDQALIEWFLAQGVLVWRGQFTFVTNRLNSPDGVNLMSNASHILQGMIMAPVTATFGAATSFAILVAANLAGTATAWYLLLSRTLGLRRHAAFIGAAFTGFAPGMMSQSNSHLHITAQWFVPAIVYCVIRLTRARSARVVVGTGMGLGALLFGQILLGEEVLFLTLLTFGLFCAVYVALRPGWAIQIVRPVAGGLAVAAVVGATLAAYPMWVQFAGKMHAPAPFSPGAYIADVATYPLFSPLTIVGTPGPGDLTTGPTEYNSFISLPIILLTVGLIIWLIVGRRRARVAVPIAVAILLMTWLSFGPVITVARVQHPGWPSLYGPLAHLPVISGALPTRYALALIPLIAVLCAYALDSAAPSAGSAQASATETSSAGPTLGATWQALRTWLSRPLATQWRSWARLAVPVAVVGAMIPNLPAPMPVVTRLPVPAFITTGAWRQCAPEGGVIAVVPLPTPTAPDPMRWPAAANDEFGLPEGFFIGPYGANGGPAIGIYPRPTSILLAQIAQTGALPTIDNAARAQAAADLAYWKADCVALEHVAHEAALRAALEQLLGPGTVSVDTWIWKIKR
jgi:hypothetical protein